MGTSKKVHSAEEITQKLYQAEEILHQSKPFAEICGVRAMVEPTYYKSRKEHGGLQIDQAMRLKELDRENRGLKRAVTHLILDRVILQDAVSRED